MNENVETSGLSYAVESWALARPFVVSRRSVTGYETIRVSIAGQDIEGRDIEGNGEASGLYYSGETIAGMQAAIADLVVRAAAGGLSRAKLLSLMPAGGARCAVDCALWDWEAKATGKPAWELAGLPALDAVATAITIGKGTPLAMAERARERAAFRTLKIKVGGDDDLAADLARIAAVRQAAGPDVRFIVDPNSSWSSGMVQDAAPELLRLGVNLLEQPTRPGAEDGLDAGYPIAICADEAVTDCASLEGLHPAYSVINIKLEKTGGLTEALRLAAQVRQRGLGLMIGCMNSTSLAMAPATLVAQGADYVDLDGPIELVRDRAHPIVYAGDMLLPPPPALWG